MHQGNPHYPTTTHDMHKDFKKQYHNYHLSKYVEVLCHSSVGNLPPWWIQKSLGAAHQETPILPTVNRSSIIQAVINQHSHLEISFSNWSVNSNSPLYPNISLHILHTALCTFPKVLTRRISSIIKSSFSWWSFPLFSWLWCLIQGWYCKENSDGGHS